jgi:hypothetical protein
MTQKQAQVKVSQSQVGQVGELASQRVQRVQFKGAQKQSKANEYINK